MGGGETEKGRTENLLPTASKIGVKVKQMLCQHSDSFR